MIEMLDFDWFKSKAYLSQKDIKKNQQWFGCKVVIVLLNLHPTVSQQLEPYSMIMSLHILKMCVCVCVCFFPPPETCRIRLTVNVCLPLHVPAAVIGSCLPPPPINRRELND